MAVTMRNVLEFMNRQAAKIGEAKGSITIDESHTAYHKPGLAFQGTRFAMTIAIDVNKWLPQPEEVWLREYKEEWKKSVASARKLLDKMEAAIDGLEVE